MMSCGEHPEEIEEIEETEETEEIITHGVLKLFCQQHGR